MTEWIQPLLIVGLLGLILVMTLQGANERQRRAHEHWRLDGQPIVPLAYFENQVSGDTPGKHRIVLSDGTQLLCETDKHRAYCERL